MNTLRVLLRKEFLQIFRNKFILLIMFQVPVIQLLILPLAATYEMKNISLSVVDRDRSTYSKNLINHFIYSGYFHLVNYADTHDGAVKEIEANKADIILEIPAGFERALVKEGRSQLMINANAIDGTKAGLATNYAGTIISRYNSELRQKLVLADSRYSPFPLVEITYSNWFNPNMDYPTFMVPGILVTLLSLVGGFLTALNIVTEKEKGTIEQINVTPVKKHIFIISKLIPFWIIGMIVFTIGLLICRVVYHIVPVGSYITLYGFAMVYMIAVLGFGLLISTYSNSQQQAMFVAFFFMIICILLSGEFTPISSMPAWAKLVTRFNPLAYFVDVMRLVMLKGSRFADVLVQFGAICAFGVILNGWAILNYKKQS